MTTNCACGGTAVSTHQDSLETQVLSDPACSYWLNARIADTRDRDPLDALRDAETLVAILEDRVRQLLEATRDASPLDPT
jgi:hypothetical protein